MTGFGKAEKLWNNQSYIIEIRTLNSAKGFDLIFKIPSNYKEIEYALRNALAENLQRGKIDFNFSVKALQEGALQIDATKLKAYFHSLKKIADELQISDENIFSTLLRMPDMLGTEESKEISEEEKNVIFDLLQNALQHINAFRTKEGESLATELKARIANIEQLRNEIVQQDIIRIANIKNRINRNLEQYIDKDKIDQNRFEQELIYYIEKLDITEELTRLAVHCQHFNAIIDSKEEVVGRKLSFLAQELGREINTIGAKANDAAMQKMVVNLKDELEKIKEQSNNIL